MFRDSRTKEGERRSRTKRKRKAWLDRACDPHSWPPFPSELRFASLCLATSVSNLDPCTSVSFLARKAYEYFSRPTLTSSRRARLADRHAEATPTRVPNEKQRSFSRKRPDRSFAFRLFSPSDRRARLRNSHSVGNRIIRVNCERRKSNFANR